MVINIEIEEEKEVNKIDQHMSEDHFDFRKGRGTRDTIGILRLMSDRCLDVIEDICFCFIDWQKAFDGVDWNTLIRILKSIGIDWRYRRIIQILYTGQKVKVRVNQYSTNSGEIGRAMRQECCISPILFNLYGEFLIGERRITTIKYADDLVVILKTKTELRSMMSRIVEAGNRYGMENNIDKSKVMRISKRKEPLRLTIENRKLDTWIISNTWEAADQRRLQH